MDPFIDALVDDAPRIAHIGLTWVKAQNQERGAMERDVRWLPAFSVGHAGLDAQHQRLLAMCSRVSRCVAGSFEGENFDAVLQELAAYSMEHSEYEEHILRQHGFPGLGAHREEHRGFMLQMLGFVDQAILGTRNRQEVADYVWRWWLDHVLVNDRAYKRWVQGIQSKAG